MKTTKGTLDVVFRVVEPNARFEPDYDYESEPKHLAFVGFLNPLLDAKTELRTYGEGEYVIYSGPASHGKTGTTWPKTLKMREVTVGPAPEPKAPVVRGL